MVKPALSVVRPDDPPGKKLSIVEAAAKGDDLALLEAMRDRIARTVQSEDCPPRDLASLTRRLDDIAKQIKVLKVEAEEEVRGGFAAPDEAFDPSTI